MFAVSRAKKAVLQALSDRDWTPTVPAADLGTTMESIDNYLDELAEHVLLRTRRVPAKTRPKTVYSIGREFVQYLVVAPGRVEEGAFGLDDTKSPLISLWSLPQVAYHPFLQEYWWQLTHSPGVTLDTDIHTVGVFGSVARGEADPEIDIDVLIVTTDETAAERVRNRVGAVRIETNRGSRIVIAEVYPIDEYRDSLARGSQFLQTVLQELHPVYDPNRIFTGQTATSEDTDEIEVSPCES